VGQAPRGATLAERFTEAAFQGCAGCRSGAVGEAHQCRPSVGPGSAVKFCAMSGMPSCMERLEQITLKIPPQLRAYYEDMARKDDRTLAGQLRHVLQRVAAVTQSDQEGRQC